MKRDTSKANRAITLGDKSDRELDQESRSKLERMERVFLKPAAGATRVYTASRYVREPQSVIWASVVSRSSGIHLLPTARESVSKLAGRGLFSALATLASLKDSHGIIFYYCDDPELPNPLQTTSPPAAFDKGQRMLWGILFELVALRNVQRWQTVEPSFPPQLMLLAQKSLDKEESRCAAASQPQSLVSE